MKTFINLLIVCALALALTVAVAASPTTSNSKEESIEQRSSNDCVLCSSAHTGYSIRTRKPPPCKGMKFKHWDPIAKKHVEFESQYCPNPQQLDKEIEEIIEILEKADEPL